MSHHVKQHREEGAGDQLKSQDGQGRRRRKHAVGLNERERTKPELAPGPECEGHSHDSNNKEKKSQRNGIAAGEALNARNKSMICLKELLGVGHILCEYAHEEYLRASQRYERRHNAAVCAKAHMVKNDRPGREHGQRGASAQGQSRTGHEK